MGVSARHTRRMLAAYREDGPQFTLLLAVDDATGVVVNALFCGLETPTATSCCSMG